MARKPSPFTAFAQLWESTSTLVALFNAERELQYLNAAVGVWLGVDANSLIGEVALFASPATLQSVVSGIAPPAEAFAGQVCRGSILSFSGEQQPQTLTAHFFPVSIEGSQPWVLMLAEPAGKAELSSLSMSSGLLQNTCHAALQYSLAQTPLKLHQPYVLGESLAVRRMRKQIQLAQQTRMPVQLIAEPGCGAEVIAALIHRESTAPLITINSALHNTESLSELLASITRVGREVPLAQPTLYFTDVHQLSAESQSQLLKWFASLPEMPRILSSAPRSLSHYVKRNLVAPALAAELSVFTLRLPPLRKRIGDISLLVQWGLEKWNGEQSQNLSGFLPEALDRMVAYNWPENVAELMRYVVQACANASETWVKASDLPERLRTNWQALAYPPREQTTIQLDAFLGDIEKEVLQRALREARQNKTKAAELLGITRQRLLRRLLQFGFIKIEEETIDFQPLDSDLPPKSSP